MNDIQGYRNGPVEKRRKPRKEMSPRAYNLAMSALDLLGFAPWAPAPFTSTMAFCPHDDERRRPATGLWLVYPDYCRHRHDVGCCRQAVRGPVACGLRGLCEHLLPDGVVWSCQLRPAYH